MRQAAVVALVIGVMSVGGAAAETPVERGAYLVNTIMTCQNCHTAPGAGGVPMFDKQLAGGLTFDEPPFKLTARTSRPTATPASARGAMTTSRS